MRVFAFVDPSTGKPSDVSAEVLHALASQLRLGAAVPDGVQSYFNTAKNLFVHSYYHYGFVPVAAFLAASAVEMAVRTVYPFEPDPAQPKRKPRPFYSLLEQAIKEGRITESGFTTLEKARSKHREAMKAVARAKGLKYTESTEPFEKQFLRSITRLRNLFAHPQEDHNLITPEMAHGLMLRSAEAINQLFRET